MAKAKMSGCFKSLGLFDWLDEQCALLKMKTPTPIQLNCIPAILKGNDCLGCAKTGSGKTAAFALPILHKLAEDPYGIFALILTPTRELANQIGEQFLVFGKPIGLRVVVVTGGRDSVVQGKEVTDRPHILVATPGRLVDHLTNGTGFSLKKIKFLVLDEADRMLDDFGDSLEVIFSAVPANRQTLLFTATMTDQLQEMLQVSNRKPFVWTEDYSVATVKSLDERYVDVPAHVKDAYLLHIIDKYQEENPKSLIMIFTHTCKYTQILAMMLTDLGFTCLPLHAMIKQIERKIAMDKFKSHQVKILVCSDLASRGLDITDVDLIINHNVPTQTKNYVHRVGRTARAGRGGLAITLVTEFDVKLIHAVEEYINKTLTLFKVDHGEVAKIAMEVAVARREVEIRLDEQDFGEKKKINKRKKLILEGKDAEVEEEKARKRRRERFRGRGEKLVKKVET